MLDYGVSTAYSRFQEAINKTPKILNLFILYPNNTCFSVLESS
jgi:hypothetical protein